MSLWKGGEGWKIKFLEAMVNDPSFQKQNRFCDKCNSKNISMKLTIPLLNSNDYRYDMRPYIRKKCKDCGRRKNVRMDA